MNKRSEIKSPKPSRTKYSQVYACFSINPRKKLRGIEKKFVTAETNDFEKQVKKYIEWMEDSKLLA